MSTDSAGKSQKKGVRRAEWTIDKRYLNVPLLADKEAPQAKLVLWVDDELLGEFDAPLALDRGDFYGFIDLALYRGRTLSVEVTGFDGELSEITLDDKVRGAENLYDEPYRPQLHFTSKRGWLNDPNGLIYYRGRYHMYYQYNPLGVHWGNMSWGHAVSDDLVHWEEAPAVLYPRPESGMCFSGAAFIDRWNQLGLKTGTEDLILAFYLRTKIGLCYAYSNDGGQTMTDYAGNPVLTHPDGEKQHADARMDTPRPFSFEPTQRWIAPTFDYFDNEEGEELRCVGLYSSDDLQEWTFESRVEQDRWGDELCGCVDMFQLPVDGDREQIKWVMVFIEGSYIVGDFDGHTFYTLKGKPASTQDRITSLVARGSYYATMTWHNMPDDRRVQITWMTNWRQHYGMPFSQQMTLPSELTLHSTADGPRLRLNPIVELETLRTKAHAWNDVGLDPGHNPLAGLNGELYEIEVEFTPGAKSVTEFDLRGVKIRYDAETRALACGDVQTRLPLEGGRITLDIWLDRASIEVYANGGRVYLPLIHAMPLDDRRYSARTARGRCTVNALRVYELESIWPSPVRDRG